MPDSMLLISFFLDVGCSCWAQKGWLEIVDWLESAALCQGAVIERQTSILLCKSQENQHVGCF